MSTKYEEAPLHHFNTEYKSNIGSELAIENRKSAEKQWRVRASLKDHDHVRHHYARLNNENVPYHVNFLKHRAVN